VNQRCAPCAQVSSSIPVEYAAVLSINPVTAHLLLTKFANLEKGDTVIQNGTAESPTDEYTNRSVTAGMMRLCDTPVTAAGSVGQAGASRGWNSIAPLRCCTRETYFRGMAWHASTTQRAIRKASAV
jgi:hypothetical protein